MLGQWHSYTLLVYMCAVRPDNPLIDIWMRFFQPLCQCRPQIKAHHFKVASFGIRAITFVCNTLIAHPQYSFCPMRSYFVKPSMEDFNNMRSVNLFKLYQCAFRIAVRRREISSPGSIPRSCLRKRWKLSSWRIALMVLPC